MPKPSVLTAVGGIAAATVLSGCILFPPFWPTDPVTPGPEIVVENATDGDWVVEAAGDFPIAFAVGAGQTGTMSTIGGPEPSAIILRDPECAEVDRLELDGSAVAIRIEEPGTLEALPEAPTDDAPALAEYFDCLDAAFGAPEAGDPLQRAGGSILLASQDGSSFALDVGRGSLERIGREPDERGVIMDFEHAWSPDGSMVAFTRMSGADGDGLYVAAADGTDQRRLVESGGSPSWSPDGGRVAYIDLDPFAGGASLAVVDVETGETTELATGVGSLAWSPDGERIAFITDSGFEEEVPPPAVLRVVDADGSDPRTLDEGAFPFAPAPSWSPDGTRLAFVAVPEGADAESMELGAAISVHDIEAGATERLMTVENGSVTDAVWAPDGAWLAVTLDELSLLSLSSNGSVSLVDPSTGEQTVLRESDDVYFTTPVWSPDGAWLAVTSAGVSELTSSLIAIRADGSEEHTLATNVSGATQWLDFSD